MATHIDDTLKQMYIKEFFVCPECGRAVSGTPEVFFTCPSCGKALCRKEELPLFDDGYCTYCGKEITRAKEEALALVDEG